MLTSSTGQPRRASPRVVIVGAGFGGLAAARALADAPVEVVIVDQRNHHTFQPLLYQVATAGLSLVSACILVLRISRGYRALAEKDPPKEADTTSARIDSVSLDIALVVWSLAYVATTGVSWQTRI